VSLAVTQTEVPPIPATHPALNRVHQRAIHLAMPVAAPKTQLQDRSVPVDLFERWEHRCRCSFVGFPAYNR
jgi:hypothetical protein